MHERDLSYTKLQQDLSFSANYRWQKFMHKKNQINRKSFVRKVVIVDEGDIL